MQEFLGQIKKQFSPETNALKQSLDNALIPAETPPTTAQRIERMMEDRRWTLPVAIPMHNPTGLNDMITELMRLTHLRLDQLTRPLAATIQGLNVTLSDHPGSIVHEKGLFKRHTNSILTDSKSPELVWFVDLETRDFKTVRSATFIQADLGNLPLIRKNGFEGNSHAFKDHTPASIHNVAPHYTPEIGHDKRRFGGLTQAIYIQLDPKTQYTSVRQIGAYRDGFNQDQYVRYPIANLGTSSGLYEIKSPYLVNGANGYRWYASDVFRYQIVRESGEDGGVFFKRYDDHPSRPSVEEEVIAVVDRLPFTGEKFSQEAINRALQIGS